jgi:hypothetical protein
MYYIGTYLRVILHIIIPAWRVLSRNRRGGRPAEHALRWWAARGGRRCDRVWRHRWRSQLYWPPRAILPKLLSVSNASRAVPLPSSDKSTPPVHSRNFIVYPANDVQTAMAYHRRHRLLRRSTTLFSANLKRRGPPKQQ